MRSEAKDKTGVEEMAEELERLSELRERGLLTDDEFADQKRKLLQSGLSWSAFLLLCVFGTTIGILVGLLMAKWF